MRVERLRALDFRCYATVEATFAPGLTAIVGANGAGKTSLLESVHFACSGFSPRTSAEANCIRDGASLTRVEADVEARGEPHVVSVGYAPGTPKRIRLDGKGLRSTDELDRWFACLVFLPDRLALVKRAASVRRAYLDRAIGRLDPGYRATLRLYGRALLQRNALLRRIRSGQAPRASLDAWDEQLAGLGAELTAARASACEGLAAPFAERLRLLGGAPAPVALVYVPRGDADPAALRRLLEGRRDRDIDRALTGAGPHLDDVAFAERARDVRAYGSQGEQRTAVLALLLAEAARFTEARGESPVLLLDDVLSELDARRRGLLLDAVRAHGQAIVTATEPAHLPAPADRTLLAVDGDLRAID